MTRKCSFVLTITLSKWIWKVTVADKVVMNFATGVGKKTKLVRKEESLRRCGEGVE